MEGSILFILHTRPLAVTAILIIVSASGVLAFLQQQAAAEAKVHRDRTIQAAGIICTGPELPKEEIAYTQLAMQRAENITKKLAEGLNVIDGGESDRVKTLQVAAKQLNKAERRVDGAYYMAVYWNIYRDSACRAERYPTEDNIGTFASKSIAMPFEIIKRTSPAYSLIYSDDIMTRLLQSTPTDSLPEVKGILAQSQYAFAVHDFEEQVSKALELARESDHMLRFFDDLKAIFLE